MVDTRATAVLARSRLFHAMPEADCQAILAAGTRRSLRKSEVLIAQGEPAAV